MANILDEYLNMTNQIIGDRTKDEKKYDNEVIRWLRKGKGIQKAINKANQKYPEEALQVDKSNIEDVAAHYDYLLEHYNIINKINYQAIFSEPVHLLRPGYFSLLFIVSA